MQGYVDSQCDRSAPRRPRLFLCPGIQDSKGEGSSWDPWWAVDENSARGFEECIFARLKGRQQVVNGEKIIGAMVGRSKPKFQFEAGRTKGTWGNRGCPCRNERLFQGEFNVEILQEIPKTGLCGGGEKKRKR